MLDATVAFILFWPSKRDREGCSVEWGEGSGREEEENSLIMGGKGVGRVSTWKE